MKRLIAVLALAALPAMAQTSNSVPFTAVTPPAPPVVTSLSGLSVSGKIYAGSTTTISGSGYAASCVVNVDGSAQPSSSFTFVSATRIDFTIPPGIGSGSGVSHALTVVCPVPILAMNGQSPVVLPNGKAGTDYPTTDLAKFANISGGVSPYKCALTTGSLPTGLTLSQSCLLSGTPSGAGSFSFSYAVADSSGLSRRIEIKDGAVSAGQIFYQSWTDPRLLANSRNKCIAMNGKGYATVDCIQ